MPFLHTTKNTFRCDYCGRTVRKGAKYVYPTPPSLAKGEPRRYHAACYDDAVDPYQKRKAEY